jgi:hypothetical protein
MIIWELVSIICRLYGEIGLSMIAPFLRLLSEEGVEGRCEEFCSVLGDEVSSFILIRRLLLTGVASGGNSSKLSRDGLFLVGAGSEWICLVGVGTEYVLGRNFRR